MTVYTSHVKPGAVPVMVQEGFSWWAALFGWVWLLVHRAWIPAILVFAASLVTGRVAVLLESPFVGLGLFVLQGMFGRDLWRWGLARRGYVEGPPVVAGNSDDALARLLSERGDVLQDLAGARI